MENCILLKLFIFSEDFCMYDVVFQNEVAIELVVSRFYKHFNRVAQL